MDSSVSVKKVSGKNTLGPMNLTAGTAIALVGICLIGAAMVVFLCVFNYTDIIVNNTAMMKETEMQPSAWGQIFVLFLTFLPGIAAYWLCKFILNKEE